MRHFGLFCRCVMPYTSTERLFTDITNFIPHFRCFNTGHQQCRAFFNEYFIPKVDIDERLQQDTAPFYQEGLLSALIQSLHDLRQYVLLEIYRNIFYVVKVGMRLFCEDECQCAPVK